METSAQPIKCHGKFLSYRCPDRVFLKLIVAQPAPRHRISNELYGRCGRNRAAVDMGAEVYQNGLVYGLGYNKRAFVGNRLVWVAFNIRSSQHRSGQRRIGAEVHRTDRFFCRSKDGPRSIRCAAQSGASLGWKVSEHSCKPRSRRVLGVHRMIDAVVYRQFFKIKGADAF